MMSSSDRRWLARAALALAFALAAPLGAQDAAVDTLTGRVIAADSTPIPRATVRLTGDDGREQTTTTDSGGRYLLTISGGSGAYVVSARAFGYLPFTASVQRAPGAARILRDFRLSARPVVLETVSVVARSSRAPERSTPAERAERWDSFLTDGHPLDPGDFTEVGSLMQGVSRSGDGLSMAGQSPDQNGATVDGATFGGGSLPSEGVRSVGVFGTTYDVSRGQFSGGQIAATTLAGTNLWGLALNAHLDDPALRYGGAPASLGRHQGRHVRASGGAGGPLVRDRLFIYGALDVSRSLSTVTGFELLDSAGLGALPVDPDSARRILDFARRVGIAPSKPSPAGSASSDRASALARVDYTLSRNSSLAVRVDWRGTELAGLGASPFRIGGGDGRWRSRDGGVFVEHGGGWGRLTNVLRVYRSVGHTRMGRGASGPTGVVQVGSSLHGEPAGSAFLTFGGAVGLPTEGRSRWEISDDFRLLTDGGHQVMAGVLLQEERASRRAAADAGTFTFNSLDELERGRPASFSRRFSGEAGEAVRRSGAAYLGDSWKPARWPRLIYGVRIDGARYARRPALAAAVDSLVGAGRGNVPSELVVTPRIGFSHTEPGYTRWSVDGGVGAFAGIPQLPPLAGLWSHTGAGDYLLSCVGPAAPAPEWSRYAVDPESLPTACADGASVFADAVPGATTFDPGFRGARTWRGSLGASRGLTPRVPLRLDFMLVRGTHLPSAVDRNLRDVPRFALADEGGRRVYAAPSEIDPVTGRIAPGAGRIAPGLGPVVELGSRGESWTAQVGASVAAPLGRRMRLGLGYTLTRSRMLMGGVGAPGVPAGTTAGDPARQEWTAAPFTPAHAFQAVLSGRPLPRVRLVAIGRLRSGTPFTPMVDADVNGDGRANDRAFLFAPGSTTDPAVAAGMRRLMDEAPAAVRGCLRSGAGRIASAGACRTPWSPSLDLRAEYMPWGAFSARRFVLGINVHDVTAGLDHLLHGPGGLRGWGQSAAPDPVLLQLRGFDAEAGAFRYDVNPGFGRTRGGGAQRVPFRVTIQGRITAGADPRYQPLLAAVDAGRGRSRESVREQIASRMTNVPAAVLQLHATDTTALALTPGQRAFLRAAADSLGPRLLAAADSLATVFIAGGAPQVRAARVQELSIRAAAVHEEAIERARHILSPEQWARLPAWVRRPVETDEVGQSPVFQMTM